MQVLPDKQPEGVPEGSDMPEGPAKTADYMPGADGMMREGRSSGIWEDRRLKKTIVASRLHNWNFMGIFPIFYGAF
jgi:hypothetical protein